MAYLCHLNRWPPLFASIAEMPAETAEVFLYCLRSEEVAAAPEDSDKALLALQDATERMWVEMGLIPIQPQ